MSFIFGNGYSISNYQNNNPNMITLTNRNTVQDGSTGGNVNSYTVSPQNVIQKLKSL